MPISWTISHPGRLVIAVAKGDLSGNDIVNFLSALDAAGARPYGKIFDASGMKTVFTDEAARLFSEIALRREREGTVGPLAIVVTDRERQRRAALYVRKARLRRPINVFGELHEARRWIDLISGAPHHDEPKRTLQETSSTSRSGAAVSSLANRKSPVPTASN